MGDVPDFNHDTTHHDSCFTYGHGHQDQHHGHHFHDGILHDANHQPLDLAHHDLAHCDFNGPAGHHHSQDQNQDHGQGQSHGHPEHKCPTGQSLAMTAGRCFAKGAIIGGMAAGAPGAIAGGVLGANGCVAKEITNDLFHHAPHDVQHAVVHTIFDTVTGIAHKPSLFKPPTM